MLKQFVVKLSEEDKKLVFEAAHISRLSMSAFARNVVVAEAIAIINATGGNK
jgi:uncharacterized protein (DUF1778 family)